MSNVIPFKKPTVWKIPICWQSGEENHRWVSEKPLKIDANTNSFSHPMKCAECGAIGRYEGRIHWYKAKDNG